jgi:antitoxin MazE
MTVNLVRIGKSKGIRIPKPIIERCGFGETVRLRVQNGRLMILSNKRPRQGRTEECRRIANAGHGHLSLEGAKPNAFDSEEWEW